MLRRIAMLSMLCAFTPAFLGAQVATGMMVGHWRGDARIAVSWTKAKTLTVDVSIAADDAVKGTIGDAKLVDGRLIRGRGAIGRALRVMSDYRIVGRLDGPIIAAENIVRENVSMPLNWIDGTFTGGLGTSGTPSGGAESMVFTATGLVLHRVADRIICENRR